MNRLFKIFKVSGTAQLIRVFVAFGITGTMSVFISDYILYFFSITQNELNSFLYWFLRICILFPVYQVLLIIVGTFFGEFKYFLNFEKKFLRRFGFKLK